jgi:hypothetical protein
MYKVKIFVVIATLLCVAGGLAGSAQNELNELVIDASKQQPRPSRGRGPFPGSPSPGHTAGLPIRLQLLMPTHELRPDGTTAVDFVVTNISTEPIILPSSTVLFNAPMESLVLWVTSDGIKDYFFGDGKTGPLVKIEAVGISAELDGHSDNPKSFYSLGPNKSIFVHASLPELIPGIHTFTAHAELGHITNTNDVIGTADSEAVTATVSAPKPTSR